MSQQYKSMFEKGFHVTFEKKKIVPTPTFKKTLSFWMKPKQTLLGEKKE